MLVAQLSLRECFLSIVLWSLYSSIQGQASSVAFGRNSAVKTIEKYMGIGEFDNTNQKIVHMLIAMKESLFDKEIGSLYKEEFGDGYFVRKYQEW